VYLAGVLILSAVTLHEPKASANGRVSHHTARNKTQLDPTLQQSDRGQQLSRLKNYEYGIPGLRPPLRRSKIQWCTELKYVNPPRTPVALVSFPGSGNTWLRYLLQQATGFYTGSVYKDYGLLKNGFPAENVANGSVLVVKTHEWGQNARKIFSKAILLVRAPGPAIQAEFNRQSGGHIGFASPDRYKRTKGKCESREQNRQMQKLPKCNRRISKCGSNKNDTSAVFL
jgi:hypothetical protein